jgi:hypothetical protein
VKNMYTETGPLGSISEPDPAFQSQVPANYFNAPRTPVELPAHSPVELRTPDFEALARRSAPGSATSDSLTYVWRR